MPKTSHTILSSWFFRIFILLSVIVTFILALSVVKSGIYYQYDVDELSHTQYTYLLDKGYAPYTSFHMIHTPIFYWLQIPLYHFLGFNFHSIYIMRLVMTVLFIIRIVLSSLFIKSVFGKKAALLFIPLLLLDPFTVFSGMQIRPDNLMVPLFVFGLLLFSYALEKRSRPLFFFSGFIFSLSVLVLIKILPATAITVILFVFYCYKNKKPAEFLLFLSGFSLPWVFLFSYFAILGTFLQMIRGIFFFAILNNMTILNVTPVTFFYQPNNYYLFGSMGKPLNWVYIYVLHGLAFLGLGLTLFKIKKNIRVFDSDTLIKVITVTVCIALIIWVFTVKGAFLQYFLPLSWLLALFSGVSLVYFFEIIKKKTSKGGVLLCLVGFIAFILFASTSIQGNLARIDKGNAGTIKGFEDSWSFIPENEATFPDQLFRPPGYPLIYGTFIGDVHPYILRHWGKVEDSLEKKKVKYVFKSDYLWQYLDPSTKEYIDAHYISSEEPGTLIRKD